MEIIKKIVRFKYKPTQIIAMGFVLVILTGTILLTLPISSREGNWTNVIDAFFTATSAVCVTGLVVKDTGTYWSIFGQTVILVLIQIGGLGFMTIGTLFALALGRKISFRERVIMQEALNQTNISGIVKVAKNILIMTFTIQAIGAILLSFRFIPLLGVSKGIGYSIFHSVSAFCNAGFDLMGAVSGPFSSLSLFQNDLWVNLVIMSLVVIGGLGFMVVMDIGNKRKFSKLSLHSKIVIKLTLLLIIIGFFAIFVFEYSNQATLGNKSFFDKVLPSLFHSITPRTAGFNTLDTGELTTSGKFFTMILMFIGGSSGSTAGGVKTTTIAIVILMIVTTIRGKEDTVVFGRTLPRAIIRKAVTIVGLALGLIITTTMILSITDPQFPFEAILFESISAFGTVGLSVGITPELSQIGRVVIAFMMFFGRVGPLTVFLALAYNKKNMQRKVKYPEERVIIG